MKAVAYLRVSTQDQSLDRQVDDIEKFAIEKGMKLVKTFTDKLSGSKTNTDDREGFIAMEDYLVTNSDIKNILVLEISRLGRKNIDIQNVIQNYTNKGINIHFRDLKQSTLNDNGQRSFESELIITMLGVMAANESRLLSARIKSGKMSRARKNQVFGGKIIGYKKGEDGTPIIDEEQAPMIKRIFEITSDGLGMRNVSTMIESEFGRKIAIGTLSGIVRNTFHKGERKYKDLDLTVPPIVSKELWQKANDSIDGRKKFGSRTKVNTNIAQGKINCGDCGNVLHQKVIPDGRIDLFVCKNDDCRNSINRPWLFRMIRLAVEKHAQKTKDNQVRERFELLISSNKAKLDVNSKTVEKLNRRRMKFQTLWVDEEISEDDYRRHVEEIKTSLEKIKVENKKLNEEIISLEKALNSKIEHFSQDLELFKTEIKDILKSVTIYKERVLINILGWREYDLKKPNSAALGWQARRLEKGISIKEELPLRKPINDEDLEIMVDDYLEENQ